MCKHHHTIYVIVASVSHGLSADGTLTSSVVMRAYCHQSSEDMFRWGNNLDGLYLVKANYQLMSSNKALIDQWPWKLSGLDMQHYWVDHEALLGRFAGEALFG
uniref:Uncharacterized protein n=1 Tax=Solanum lycopersicum TaxID=4081 RepID=A0A3Q7HG41_SOLLC